MNRPVPSPRHKTLFPLLLASALAVAGLLLPCPVSQAQTTWTDSTGNGLWSDGANWDMAEPNGTDVILPAPFPSPNATIALDPGEMVGDLTFNEGYTLEGGDLTVTSWITVDTGNSATIKSTILSSLRKRGLGSLAVHDINGVFGQIRVEEGTLIVADTAGVPTGVTNLVVKDGSTIVNGTAMSLDWTSTSVSFDGASNIGAGGDMKFEELPGLDISIFNSTEVTGKISASSLGVTQRR